MSIFEVHNSSDQALLTLGGATPSFGSANMSNTRMVSSGAILEVRSGNTVNAETTNTFKIESTNAANSHYPIFKLAKDVAGASVVDGYKGPKMAMTCASDNGTEKEVMSINSIVSDASNNVMSTEVDFAVRADNSMKTFMSAKGDGLHTKLEISDDNFIISSDQTGSSNSPDLILRKGDTGVQDNENLGTIQFEGYNNASDPELVNYVSVRGEIDEIDDGTEGGRFAVDVMSSGTMKEAFLINGDGLTLDAEFQQTTFRLNGFSNLASEAPTLELNRERTNAPSANDEIGRVLFAGEDSGQARVEYAEIQSKIIDPAAGDMDGRLNVSVSKAGSMTEVVGVTHNGGDVANNAATANEQKLKGVELHGTSLEELTRRCVLTYQVGENGDISNDAANDATESFLRGANGVPSVGSTFAGSVGIMVPFDGHIIAGNFSAIKDSGVNANLHLEIDRIQPDDTVTSIRIASNNNTGDAKPKSDTYPYASPNTTRSSALEVSAGDMLIPKMIVDSLSGTYVLTDVFAQFYLYTESMVQS